MTMKMRDRRARVEVCGVGVLQVAAADQRLLEMRG
jgi:hypothetical protein